MELSKIFQAIFGLRKAAKKQERYVHNTGASNSTCIWGRSEKKQLQDDYLYTILQRSGAFWVGVENSSSDTSTICCKLQGRQSTSASHRDSVMGSRVPVILKY